MYSVLHFYFSSIYFIFPVIFLYFTPKNRERERVRERIGTVFQNVNFLNYKYSTALNITLNFIMFVLISLESVILL